MLRPPPPPAKGIAAFQAATSELPVDADLDIELVRTDGVRTWRSDDLDHVTETPESDPMWLRLQAGVNALRDLPAT